MKNLLITIDGPAGAGKTTVSRTLADHLGYTYVDTGALYRGIAFEVNARNVIPDDDQGLENICNSLVIRLVPSENGLRLFSGENDITEKIRTPEISMMASAVSAKPVVRTFLLELQRELGNNKCAVFEGRDMGTVVFPDADIKFFLDASLEQRALRRFNELREQSQTPQSFEDVIRDMRKRDDNDSNRDIAPLKPAGDAIIIDSTKYSVEEVIEQMLFQINKVD